MSQLNILKRFDMERKIKFQREKEQQAVKKLRNFLDSTVKLRKN